MQQNLITTQISQEFTWITIFLCLINTTTSLSMSGVRMLSTMEWLHLCTISSLLESLQRMVGVLLLQIRVLQLSLLSEFQVQAGRMETMAASLSIVSSIL
jgi:hypothetical protein